MKVTRGCTVGGSEESRAGRRTGSAGECRSGICGQRPAAWSTVRASTGVKDEFKPHLVLDSTEGHHDRARFHSICILWWTTL